MHREGDRATNFSLGREVASLIPGAAFLPMHGDAHLAWKGDWQAVVTAIVDFLSGLHPRAAEEDMSGLSPREHEVAALVAEGLTNQDIGRRLFITARTAETHLENIRRKLGVRSRAQVAAWFTLHRGDARTPAP
jgi:DNA-binding CsgD family transcriptional regulator